MGKEEGEGGEDIPSDAMNFWYLAWFEDCIGHTTKGSSDIEGDDERAGSASIGLAHVRGGLDHDGA